MNFLQWGLQQLQFQTFGWDSILSILQMPGGIPVATVALNGVKKAGILAATIIDVFDPLVRVRTISNNKKPGDGGVEEGG